MPIRSRIGGAAGVLASAAAIAFCTATAQCTALATLANSISTPSP
jgi:hypothetical protein